MCLTQMQNRVYVSQSQTTGNRLVFLLVELVDPSKKGKFGRKFQAIVIFGSRRTMTFSLSYSALV